MHVVFYITINLAFLLFCFFVARLFFCFPRPPFLCLSVSLPTCQLYADTHTPLPYKRCDGDVKNAVWLCLLADASPIASPTDYV